MADNEEQLNDAVELKGLMTSFQANLGWMRMREIIQELVLQRDRKLDDPLRAMDEVLQQEYVKGARQAYRHVLDLPEALISDAKAVIEMVETLPEEEDDYGAEAEQ